MSKISWTAAAACRLSGVDLSLAGGHRADRRTRRVAYRRARGDERRIRIFDPLQRRRVQGGPQDVGRLQQLQRHVVLEVGERPLADPLDLRRSQLGRGGAGHPGHQFVRLVDDHRTVLGQRGAAVHRIDGQQRVVGDHQVRAPGLVARAFDEALVSVGAPLRTEALAYRDRHLLPGPVGVRRGVVAIGQTPLAGLFLGPLPQRQHLRAEGRLRRAQRCGLDRVGQIAGRDQRALILRGAVPDPQQAGVVGPALEDRVPGALAGDRLDGVQRGRDVVVGQLALQGQRRGGDHDPLVGLLSQPDQGRRQVAQRLSRPGAGLHEQVPAGVERVGDRVGHLDLSGPFAAVDPLDGGGQHIAMVGRWPGLRLSGHR